MLKIADAVRTIVSGSEMACLALEEGCLNLSKYAESIKPQVERLVKKNVSTGTIVAALARIRIPSGFSLELLPPLRIFDVSLKSNLVEVAYEKTREHVKMFNALYCNRDVSSSDFFMFTQGNKEIAVVAQEEVLPPLLDMFQPSKPKTILRDLSGLTLRFSEEDIQTPNLLYALLRSFAMERLRIVELISTHTELTLIVNRKDVEQAFHILNSVQSGTCPVKQ